MGQPKYTNRGKTYDYTDIVKLDDDLVAQIMRLEEQYKKPKLHNRRFSHTSRAIHELHGWLCLRCQG
jgi:hypothetical protein